MIGSVSEYLKTSARKMELSWHQFWYTPVCVRPLCVLRICVGILSLFYHSSWTADLLRWFGPHGLLPNETVAAIRAAGLDERLPWEFSFFQLTNHPVALWTIHALSGMALLAFTVGFRTRYASVLALVSLLGYIHRAPMLAAHAEPVLTMLVAYLCLAPCGRYYSLDSWLARRRGWAQRDESSLSVSAGISRRLLQVHLAGFYLMFALTKLAGEVWWDGEAMWWLIAQADSPLIDLTFLRYHPLLLSLWTHAVVAFELGYALLIWNRHWQPFLLALSVLMWTLLALVTGLITFCLLMIVSNLAFIRFPPVTGKDAVPQATAQLTSV